MMNFRNIWYFWEIWRLTVNENEFIIEELPKEDNIEEEGKSKDEEKKNGLSTGAIIGILISWVAVVSFVVALTLFILKKKKKVNSETIVKFNPL